MKNMNWNTLAAYGALAVAALGVLIDLLNAEGLIRSALRAYFPKFPSEVTVKQIEVSSLSAYKCATEGLSGTLKVVDGNARIIARIIQNTCQDEMKGVIEILKSPSPSDVLHKASYTIVINGLKHDIKRLTLIAGSEHNWFGAVLSGTALAHCNTVERNDGAAGFQGEGLSAVEVILEHNGTPVRLDLQQSEGSDRQALRDSDCPGVFTYPH